MWKDIAFILSLFVGASIAISSDPEWTSNPIVIALACIAPAIWLWERFIYSPNEPKLQSRVKLSQGWSNDLNTHRQTRPRLQTESFQHGRR